MGGGNTQTNKNWDVDKQKSINQYLGGATILVSFSLLAHIPASARAYKYGMYSRLY
jgi:hypothetical protein